MAPAQNLGQTVSSVNSYCAIILEYLVVRDVNITSVKLRCLHLTFSSVIFVKGVQACLPSPGFGSDSVISQFLLHHNLGKFNCMRYKHYFGQTEMFASNFQFGYPCPRGGGQAVQAGLSCPPAQDLGQAVSSVNFYCTIILEYLVVGDINIISVKLRCLHSMFSLVTLLVRGVCVWGGEGGKLSRLVYLTPHPPAQDLGRTVSSVNSYCTIILEYIVVRDVNIISVKLTCLHLMFSLVILVRGASYPGWLISCPCPGFWSNSVIS